MRSVYMLVNPAARRGRALKAAGTVAALLREKGVEPVRINPDSATSIAPLLIEARHAGMERLIIVGGDGLIHHALPALAGTEVTVAIVPSGTGNDFARALNIPINTKEAVSRALVDGVAVDLIRSADRWAASVVTGGWSGDINERAARIRFPQGQQRYTLATLLELRSLKPVPLHLEIDGVKLDKEVTLFAIGNTAYFGGGMKVCPTARPSDGLLEVALLEPVSVPELLTILPKIFSGKHLESSKVSTWRARSVEVATSASLWADGEPFGEGAVELQSCPGSLRVAGAGLDSDLPG